MSVIDKIMGATPNDIIKTSVVAGALAGLTGAATLVDKYVFDYTLGFKSTRSNTDVLLRGAAVGLIFGLPVAYYNVMANKNGSNLGGVKNYIKDDIQEQPSRIRDYVKSRHTHRLPPPPNYVYTTDEAGRQILILDPKSGL